MKDHSRWQLVSDSILLHIFSYLGASDLIRLTEVCKTWKNVANDEFLWKALFCQEWKTNGSLAPGKKSWLSEYKLLKYHAPLVESEVLTQHKECVLHVSFSHDGSMFVSSSKDCIKLWNVNLYPATIRYDFSTLQYGWEAAHFSQFNEKDTFLLVCVSKNYLSEGAIIIFNVKYGFIPVIKTLTQPYDLFSAWYGVECFLSSRFSWLHQGDSCTTIWKNNVYEPSNPKFLYRFSNRNTTLVSSMMVARFLRESTSGDDGPLRRTVEEESYLIFTHARRTVNPHKIGFKKMIEPTERLPDGATFDSIDHSIDVRAGIVGMALSPDQKYLYVSGVPILDRSAYGDAVINVIDLLGLCVIRSTLLSSHTAVFTRFIFLDVSTQYVSSGSENGRGCLWARHYGNCLTRFPHDTTVTCAVFNPLDSEMVITASEDGALKIWRSRNRTKELERKSGTR